MTPLQANYKVAREQSVLAIDSNSICNVHNATSAVGVQFVTDNTPIDTLNLGVDKAYPYKLSAIPSIATLYRV